MLKASVKYGNRKHKNITNYFAQSTFLHTEVCVGRKVLHTAVCARAAQFCSVSLSLRQDFHSFITVHFTPAALIFHNFKITKKRIHLTFYPNIFYKTINSRALQNN